MDNPDDFIIEQLLCNRDRFVSGESLAKSLRISRVSVSEHIKKLTEQGFLFEAIRNRGYRLAEFPQSLHGSLLANYLKEKKDSYPFFLHPVIDSTNDEADRLLANGTQPPFVVLSHTQTKGRGRLGRQWVSSDPSNLYMTVAFTPPALHPSQMQLFTLWMGVSFCQFINDKFQISLQVKWPNDIMGNGKKLGGILTESQIDTDSIRKLILGFGLNVNTDMKSWPTEVFERATSIKKILNNSININELASSIIHCAQSAYTSYQNNEYKEKLFPLWDQLDFLKGKEIVAMKNQKRVEGIASGITSTGQLIVQQHHIDSPILLDSGEATLKSHELHQ